jgi:hypothetical protein
MKTMAQTVQELCEGKSAYTLYGGYAVGDGYRVLFCDHGVSTAKAVTPEKRNKDGRCTFAHFSYEDGSQIEFRWSPKTGSQLRVIK